MYAIVDIETTGNGIRGNKITEIAIFKFDGEQVVDEFTSLVNPECEIPYFITALTGIDNQMVRNAPTLREIAGKIASISEAAIFVAHSVNFDYHVIKDEFRSLGLDFTRKKLCTVRLSRKLLPSYHSYSLGKLCSALNIPLQDRHRARGDAHATLILFQRLLRTEGAEEAFRSFLNARSQEATLPPSLPRAIFENLPAAAGIYRFKNAAGSIIYIGKAINIRKRVLGHFYDKSTREVAMCRETVDIEFELAGNELVALLMESAEIKRHFPQYNLAQKRRTTQYALCSYEDRQGILHLAFNKSNLVPRPLITFPAIAECRLYLEQVCREFHLCAKYCHLQENVATCFHYRLSDCMGICRGEEPVGDYNSRVKAAIAHITARDEDFLIRENGRSDLEDAVVLVRNGKYYGYGFIPRELPQTATEAILARVQPQKNTVETQRIVMGYAIKYPATAVTIALSEFLSP